MAEPTTGALGAPRGGEGWWTMLRALGACPEAVTWARTQPDARTAWATCARGDWLLWIAVRLAVRLAGDDPTSPARRAVTLAACAVARTALPRWAAAYPDDPRPAVAIETAERFARGEAGVTRDAAAADAAAAYAAAAAAAYAAYAADVADAAGHTTRAQALAASADVVRQMIPFDTLTLPEVACG